MSCQRTGCANPARPHLESGAVPSFTTRPARLGAPDRESESYMSALTDAVTPPPSKSGLPCSMAVALDRLDPDSAADLQAWLEGKRPELGWTDGEAHARLQALGMRVGRQTVGRHRRWASGSGMNVCRCAQ